MNAAMPTVTFISSAMNQSQAQNHARKHSDEDPQAAYHEQVVL